MSETKYNTVKDAMRRRRACFHPKMFDHFVEKCGWMPFDRFIAALSRIPRPVPSKERWYTQHTGYDANGVWMGVDDSDGHWIMFSTGTPGIERLISVFLDGNTTRYSPKRKSDGQTEPSAEPAHTKPRTLRELRRKLGM